MFTGEISWIPSLQQKIKRMSEKVENQEREHSTLYSRPGKNTGDISGSAARTITLKPASAKAVLPILAAQECFAREANAQDRIKNWAVSVKPANFSGNSGSRESTSVSNPKNLRLLKKA